MNFPQPAPPPPEPAPKNRTGQYVAGGALGLAAIGLTYWAYKEYEKGKRPPTDSTALPSSDGGTVAPATGLNPEPGAIFQSSLFPAGTPIVATGASGGKSALFNAPDSSGPTQAILTAGQAAGTSTGREVVDSAGFRLLEVESQYGDGPGAKGYIEATKHAAKGGAGPLGRMQLSRSTSAISPQAMSMFRREFESGRRMLSPQAAAVFNREVRRLRYEPI